jgi:hypothetical protein
MGCPFMTGLGDWEAEDLALVGMKECKDNKVAILVGSFLLLAQHYGYSRNTQLYCRVKDKMFGACYVK